MCQWTQRNYWSYDDNLVKSALKTHRFREAYRTLHCYFCYESGFGGAKLQDFVKHHKKIHIVEIRYLGTNASLVAPISAAAMQI